MALNKYVGKSNSFGTGYVDDLFKKQYNFSPRRTDQDTINRIYKSLQDRNKMLTEPEEGRSLLNRTFDALSVGNYMVAGAVDGAIRDDKTILQGVVGGLKAANPFGKGYTEGETTFSDVLRSAGWESDDEGFGTKASRGTVGFVLDVLLDPTTYMTFGTSAIIKGTGKVGKAVDTIETLAKNNPQFADGLRQAGSLTDEMAVSIVDKINAGKDMSAAQRMAEAKELKNKYNSLIGVDRQAQGISFGVRNMPFGDKIADKLGIKSNPTTLVKGSTLQRVSDATGISGAYGATRNAIYGSKIGKYLSNNAGLKGLAEVNPAKLYEYIGAVNAVNGKNLDKISRDKEIREIGTKMLGLNPSDHKKIITALETPSIWSKVKEQIKFGSTDAGKQMKQDMVAEAGKLNNEIADLTTLRNEYQYASQEELVDYATQLQVLQKRKDLTIKQTEQLKEIEAEIQTLRAEKSSTRPDVEGLSKSYDEAIKDYNKMYEAEGEEVAVSKYNEMSPEDIRAAFDGFTSSSKDYTKRIGETSGAMRGALTGQKRLLDRDLRHEVSEYFFGKKDYLASNADAQAIHELAELIKAGQGKADEFEAAVNKSNILDAFTKEQLLDSSTASGWNTALREFIENNPNFVDNSKKKIYQHLANKYGYKAFSDLIDQRETLREALRMDRNKRKAGSPEMIEMNRINGVIKARNEELAKLSKMSPKALAKYFEEMKFAELSDELDYLLFGEASEAVKYKDAINQYSEGANGKARAEIGYYGKMQGTRFDGMTKEQAEYQRFVELTNDKKYTLDEVLVDKEDLKATLLRARQKRIFEGAVTPETIATVSELRKMKALHNKLTTEYEALYKKSVEFPSQKMNNIVDRVAQKMNSADKRFKELSAKLKNETNYNQAVKQSKALNGEEVTFIDKQAEAMLSLANKVFPQHKYQHLTSGQQNFIQTTAYYMLRDHRAKGGNFKEDGIIQRLADETFEKNILPNQQKKMKEQLKEQKIELLSDKLDVGMGIKIETDEGIVDGIIVQKKEEKVTKERKSTEVTYTDGGEGTIERKKLKKGEVDPNTGKVLKKDREVLIYNKPASIRNESVNTFKYEEGTGLYTFQARLATGETITVDATKVKGTFVDDMTYDTTVLPLYSKQELQDALDYAESIKSKLDNAKKQEVDHAEKVAKADQMLETLLRKKEGLESSIRMMGDIEREIGDTLDTLKANSDTLGESADTLTAKLDELIKRKEEVSSALDSDDAFEIYAKRELGTNYSKFTTRETGDYGINDVQNYSDVVRFYSEGLRKDFINAGLGEVQIGKLSSGQFETMMEKYYPRILTKDAEAYFRNNPTQAEKYGQVTNDYGFGQEWNPYSKSRSSDFQTTQEANDFFESEIGMRIFEENIGQAYINRMLKNSDLMYDNQAMTDLMQRFGHEIVDGKVNDGYTAVANYGQLRDHIRGTVAQEAKADIAEVLKRKNEMSKDELKQVIDDIYKSYTEKVVDGLGLDRKLIAGESTPLVKLNEKQLKAFNEAGISNMSRQINNMTVDKLNQQKQLIMERDEKQLLKVYDKFMTFIKLNQTTLMPGFWVQTKVGNLFQGWMGVGRDVFDSKMNKAALEATRNIDDINALRALGPIMPTDLVNGTVRYWDEVVDLARGYNVINTDFMTKDFASHSFMEGTKMIPGKYDPFNTTEFIGYKVGGKITSTIDNQDRLLQFASLLRQGKTAQEASDTVNKYLFDYGDLTTFEKRVMKRIFPYYTWMRKNTPLIMREVIEQPEKMALMAKVHNAINHSSGDDQVDRTFVTGFAEDWLQLPFNITGKDGQTSPVLMNPKLPYMDLRNIPVDGDLGSTAREYFNQTAPMLKLPIELMANWNSFFDEPIAREGEPQLTPRLLHVASQLAAFNAVKNFVKAEGDDKLLAAVNTVTGTKITSYNLEANKENVYQEAYEKQFKQGFMEVVGQGVVRFGQEVVGSAKGALSDVSVALAGKPAMTAIEYDGALSPITPERYAELSDKEKEKYSLSNEEGVYLNNRAKELEAQAYAETGKVKKFLWTLFEGDYPGGQTVGRINKVVDGDTFRTTINGETKDIRLMLVDTPESVGRYADMPMQGGKEASEYSKSLLLGKDVRLLIDSVDKYGRITAFVEVGGEDVGEKLIEGGYGRTRYEDMAKGDYTKVLEQYYNKEAEASKEGRGQWAKPY